MIIVTKIKLYEEMVHLKKTGNVRLGWNQGRELSIPETPKMFPIWNEVVLLLLYPHPDCVAAADPDPSSDGGIVKSSLPVVIVTPVPFVDVMQEKHVQPPQQLADWRQKSHQP